MWKFVSAPYFKLLCTLTRADEAGCVKTVEEDEYAGIDAALKKPLVAECLKVGQMPERILSGDDLIAAGYTAGPAFKHALDLAHRDQIDFGIIDKTVLLKRAKGYLNGAA